MSVLFFPDSLGRIIREDNKSIDKTLVYNKENIPTEEKYADNNGKENAKLCNPRYEH